LKAFIDTSSLFKKYIEENGSQEFGLLLENISEIIVSPITIIEFHSVIARKQHERGLNVKDAEWIETEFLKDYNYFHVVKWSDELIKKSVSALKEYQLKTLDSIQLASAILTKPDVFIVSDQKLFNAAKKKLQNAKYID
jgi:predicted nucleic acid-binding protein